MTDHHIALLNEAALYDQEDRAITFPRNGDHHRDQTCEMNRRLRDAMAAPSPEQVRVWSFDIDLTVRIPEDEPHSPALIEPELLNRLRQDRTIVGTCSDRAPSEQRDLMRSLNVEPDFCIPKEMLVHLRRMLPNAQIIHVGDDAQRDRLVAERAGVVHLWPQEAIKMADA